MYGVKLYLVPENLDKTIEKWHQLGFDTLFIGQSCKHDTDFLERLQKEKFFVNLIEPVFLAENNINKKYLAIKKDGTQAVDSWVRFICPSNRKMMSAFYRRIKKDACLPVNSLSLDFIRFFQFWEMMNPQQEHPDLVQTCYCKKCQKAQKEFPSVEEWRCSVVSSVVEKSEKIIKNKCSSKLVGLHLVPWTKDTFGNARQEILGQNLKMLKSHVNFFTPMLYHHMLHQKPAYVLQTLELLEKEVDGKVPFIPSIQAKEYYRQDTLTVEEITETARSCLKRDVGRKNLVYFQWTDIEENPKLYNSLVQLNCELGEKNEKN